MKKISALILLIGMAVTLQGCVHKLVTVPVKAAYKVSKGVVKGTVKVVEAVIPDDSDKKND